MRPYQLLLAWGAVCRRFESYFATRLWRIAQWIEQRYKDTDFDILGRLKANNSMQCLELLQYKVFEMLTLYFTLDLLIIFLMQFCWLLQILEIFKDDFS